MFVCVCGKNGVCAHALVIVVACVHTCMQVVSIQCMHTMGLQNCTQQIFANMSRAMALPPYSAASSLPPAPPQSPSSSAAMSGAVIGAIVGGAAGGLVLLALVAWAVMIKR